MPHGTETAHHAPNFLHTWAISDITAWETWQGVFRAAGEEPSGHPEGMSMRSGTDFRNGDGAP